MMKSAEPRSKKVSFLGHDGVRLAGFFHEGFGRGTASAILCHCFTCSKDYKVIVWLARELAKRGCSSLRFDFAGLGDSDGTFAETTLSSDIGDLKAAAMWLRERSFVPSSLIGHSMGGTVSILAAESLPTVKTVSVLGTGPEPGRITRLLSEDQWKELEAEGSVTILIGGREHPLSWQFIQDLQAHSILETVSEWTKALLVIQGMNDEIVRPESAKELFSAARDPKAFFSLPGADHLFAADRSHTANIAEVIRQWMDVIGD